MLVDSDILIAHLRGLHAAISGVSVAELVGGMRSAQRREVWRSLASFRAEPATVIIARRAGDFRRKYRHSHDGIGLGDYLIAGTAEVKGYDLATLNVRHFPMFENLRPPFNL